MPATTVRQVHFAQNAYASRLPRDDEIFVMQQFASHASHCNTCAYPYETYIRGGQLCSYGHIYAKDVAQYIYCKSGKAFSTIDRHEDDARVQIEIPRDCEVIRELLKAVDKGMRLPKNKPVISYEPVEPVYTRKTSTPLQPLSHNTTTKYYEIEERVPKTVSTYPQPQPKQKIYIKGRGSLYKKDVTERKRREEDQKYEGEPIIISAAPRRAHVRAYHR